MYGKNTRVQWVTKLFDTLNYFHQQIILLLIYVHLPSVVVVIQLRYLLCISKLSLLNILYKKMHICTYTKYAYTCCKFRTKSTVFLECMLTLWFLFYFSWYVGTTSLWNFRFFLWISCKKYVPTFNAFVSYRLISQKYIFFNLFIKFD